MTDTLDGCTPTTTTADTPRSRADHPPAVSPTSRVNTARVTHRAVTVDAALLKIRPPRTRAPDPACPSPSLIAAMWRLPSSGRPPCPAFLTRVSRVGGAALDRDRDDREAAVLPVRAQRGPHPADRRASVRPAPRRGPGPPEGLEGLMYDRPAESTRTRPPHACKGALLVRAPSGTRTPDPLIKSQLL